MALFKRHDGNNAPNFDGVEYERPRRLVDLRWLAKQDDLDECWYDIEGRLGWKSGNFGHAWVIGTRTFQPTTIEEAEQIWRRGTRFLWARRQRALNNAMRTAERNRWNEQYVDEAGNRLKAADGITDRSLATIADDEAAVVVAEDPRMDFDI